MKFLLIFLSLIAFAISANIPQEVSAEPYGLIEDSINAAINSILDMIPTDPITIPDYDGQIIDSDSLKLHIRISNFKIEHAKTLNITCSKVNLVPMGANIVITLPNIEVSTDYTVSLQIRESPAKNANGNILFTLTNLVIECETLFNVTYNPLSMQFTKISMLVPDLIENTQITLRLTDVPDPALAEAFNREVSKDIPIVLKFIDDNQAIISNAIGPIIADIINSILPSPEENTPTTSVSTSSEPSSTPTPTPTTDDNETPTPAPGSASVASFSLFTVLAALICINVL